MRRAKQSTENLGRDETTIGLASEGVSQYLTFEVNADIYGINILGVKEIIDHGNVTIVPMMPPCIAGVINLRGSVVPVVDLAIRFSKESSIRTKRSSVIILEIEYQTEKIEIGVTVDVVNEVLNILSTEIEATPEFGTRIRADFIDGIGKVNNQLLVLLNVSNILSIDELAAV